MIQPTGQVIANLQEKNSCVTAYIQSPPPAFS
jgi:hypothetical protein